MSDQKNLGHNSKKDFLKNPVEHIDITSFDARKIISSMEKMSFVSRETANAANIYNEMLKDKECTIFLTLAGSTSAAGCMNIYKDLVKYNMVDAIVATGASIIDMDFFEALGFKHYQGSQFQDDTELRKNYIDRIYDTYIDEEELQECDKKICEIADTLEPRSYTSREFIYEMGKYLKKYSKKKNKCLDFGGGGGVFLPTLSKLFSNVVSIDLEISEAEKICSAFNLINIDLIHADILSKELSDSTFDAIIAADVLEHFKDLKPAVKKINGWLKTDGVLVTSLPTENWVYVLLRLIFGVKKPFDHYHSGYEVECFLKNNGFERVHRSNVPLYFGILPLYLISVWRKS